MQRGFRCIFAVLLAFLMLLLTASCRGDTPTEDPTTGLPSEETGEPVPENAVYVVDSVMQLQKLEAVKNGKDLEDRFFDIYRETVGDAV